MHWQALNALRNRVLGQLRHEVVSEDEQVAQVIEQLTQAPLAENWLVEQADIDV